LHAYHPKDIMRQLHALPSGRLLLALLFACASYLAATGYDTLGLRYVHHPLPYPRSALAGLPDHALAPLWNQVGTLLFQYGEYFYNFQGLRQFKEKFEPVCKPPCLADPGGWALPTVLTSLAALVSSGLKGAIAR
jgi:hypothetical protein